jgi:regulator of nucleoside diphosphate kinase
MAPATASSHPITVGAPVLSVRDFTALERFARLQLPPSGAIYAALLAKLEQSRMLPVDAAVSSIASLGSRVVFSVDGSTAEGRVLVLPSRHSPAGWTLPVTTPRGLALLGYAPGAVIAAVRRDGTAEALRLIAVTHEADGTAAGDPVSDHREAEQTRADAPAPSRVRRVRP